MSDLRPQSEIAEGVHWIKDRYVNNYIIEDGDETILIDTALNKKAKNILHYIKTELKDKTVSKIYLTHHHLDHTGGLFELHRQFHPRIFVSEQDSFVVTGNKKSPLPRSIFLKPLFFILFPMIKPKPVTQVELVGDGERQDNFTIYHLPGHTMGSLGFLKDNVFFSGDAAITSKGRVKPGLKMFAESISDVYKSVQKLGTLTFDMILPGHGTPILEDASSRVKDAIEALNLNE